MSEFRPATTSETEWGMFSSTELERLMRVEFERARRYQYDLCCLAVAVDRLGLLHDLYGTESRSEILGAVIGLMKSTTRLSDFPRCQVDDYLLVMFPYTSREGSEVLVKRLLKNARGLKFESEGRTIQITLSIGLSHSGDRAVDGFDALVQRAQTGLALARAAGGNRWMQSAAVESELGQFKSELEDLRRELDRRVAEVAAGARGAATAEEMRGEDVDLVERIRALFAMQTGRGPDSHRLEAEVVKAALQAVQEERRRHGEPPVAVRSDSDAVESMERRIAKLTRALRATEEELARVAAEKSVDPGVASMYRTVQGLSAEAKDTEQKLQVLARIFEANVELRKRVEGGR